ncbi:DEAD-box ATP-dependent RNA helicase 50 [Artemisia annua]|uniref:DEAD-box ATP-dependent RNA helicase 50 n=1 Tax=Artemisia annua TaxID=35608 RepID=A0A2U1MDN2_ARTAN|nr:DEAD-box ATP-dependent RNA helicase 50 [Artemisia annua]
MASHWSTAIPRRTFLEGMQGMFCNSYLTIENLLRNCRLMSKSGVPFRSMIATGGFKQKTQMESLRNELDVLIGTPSRFLYLVEEGFLQLTNLKWYLPYPFFNSRGSKRAEHEKLKIAKEKRNGDKEEEYEIFARTNSERDSIWQHFDPVRVKKDGLRRALCKFCNKTIAASGSNGTSGLHKHYPCPSNSKYESKNKVQQQTHLELKKNSNDDGTSSLQTWKHDESRIKKALINMFVVGEIPFKFVEHEAFVEYTNACNGRFMFPSRHKLPRDVSKYYLDERNNAPSNDKELDHLIKKLPNAKIYDDGKHFHIRCMAHILNLIVKEATLLDPTMKQQLVSHGFKKMLEYNMSSESPLPDDALNAMVREMLKEVVNKMGVLFQTYKTRFDTVVSKKLI